MPIKDKVQRTIKKVVQSVDSKISDNNLRFHWGSTTMNNTKPKKKMGFVKTVINIGHRFLVLMFRMLIQFLYGEKGESMPPIKNLILLDSATTLAYKIRTRKVCLARSWSQSLCCNKYCFFTISLLVLK